MMFAPQESGPRVFNISSGIQFADGVIDGLLARLRQDDPLAMAQVTILAPTRRGARTLSDVLMRRLKGPAFGPRILTLDDVETLAPPGPPLLPAIGSTERLAVLTRLVRKLEGIMPQIRNEPTAVALAGDLASLLDRAQNERVPLERLDQLVEQDLATHWEKTTVFLQILREAWPHMLAERGKCDPVERRAALVTRIVEGWKTAPVETPVIVAGSTGSVGLSAELIGAIAELPQGAVILPGLDRELDSAAFHELSEREKAGPKDAHKGTPEHPQNGLSRLLLRLSGGAAHLDRSEVEEWTQTSSPRAAFLSVAQRPAPVTDQWNAQRIRIAEMAREVLGGIALIEAETPEDEAGAIAIAIREALEEPEKTVALITSDRKLARRVTAQLSRWKITPDDSAGTPLASTAPGIYLEMVSEWAFGRETSQDPVPLLSLLKHPFSRIGMPRKEHLSLTRRVERYAMRGEHATGADIALIRKALMDRDERKKERLADQEDAPAYLYYSDEMAAWLDRLEEIEAMARTLPVSEVSLSDAARRLRDILNALTQDDTGSTILWDEPQGEGLDHFLEEMEEHGEGIGPMQRQRIGGTLSAFMAGRTVRPPFGNHPRVFIWGTLEARMQSAHRVILGSLNEDGWPRLPENDPWMSRGMLSQMGLPPLERRIGLSAHDFQQAFCAKDVILTRARKEDGTPTVASRWLQRITTLLGDEGKSGFAPEVLEQMRETGRRYLAHAKWLTGSAQEARPAIRPKPSPALALRPQRLSVTEIETLIRDPYAIYAKHVLRLRPLDSLIPEPDPRVRGEVMHEIVELFVRRTMKDWPSDPAIREKLFKDATDEALDRVGDWPVFRLFYRARAERITQAFLSGEDERRAQLWQPALIEEISVLRFALPDGSDFTLKGRADRLDRYGDDWAIYDYKGSSSPSTKQIDNGYAPQLKLTGMMLEHGAFEGASGKVRHMAYIKLGSGKTGVEEITAKDCEALLSSALPEFQQLLLLYRDPARPYTSRLMPEEIKFAGDYDHLARVDEWNVAEGGS